MIPEVAKDLIVATLLLGTFKLFFLCSIIVANAVRVYKYTYQTF